MEYSFNVLFPSFSPFAATGKVRKEHFVKVFPVHSLPWRESCTSYLYNDVVLVRESTDHSFFGFERIRDGAIVRLKIDSFSSIILISYRI